MAIWQYLLIVVPENSIDINYQCIFKNNQTEYLPETDLFWKDFEGNISTIISEMDQKLFQKRIGAIYIGKEMEITMKIMMPAFL